MAKAARYQRFEDRIEIPMVVLSLLLIPVVLMPLTQDLSPASTRALGWLSAFVWIAFAVEYVTLVYLSTDRIETIRNHKLDLVLVALPFLRPLRLLRVARLTRAGTALGQVSQAFREILGRPGFGPMVLTATGFIVVSGGLVAIAENGQPDSSIENFGDGLWWALVTCTTVGYGDEYPVTFSGRLIAALLMVVGISVVSAVTASVAAYFVSATRKTASTDPGTTTTGPADPASGTATAGTPAMPTPVTTAVTTSATTEPTATVTATTAELHRRLERIESQLDALLSQRPPGKTDPD